jgi:uncharacterized OsmC-like protein
MYTVTIENRGDARYHATSRGYGFVLGPQGAGANPGDTLLAALCGCIGHYVREFLGERGIASEGFAMSAEADSTPDESRLARIEVWIDLRATSLDEAGRTGLLAAARRCKIHNTLEAACPVTISLGKQRPAAVAPAQAAGICGWGGTSDDWPKGGSEMTAATHLDRTHHFILETFVERGYAPHYTEIAARFGVAPEEGKKLLHDLMGTGLPA